MYYLLVYLQLVLLSPILFRLLDHKVSRCVLYLVTPVTLVVRYALALEGIGSMHINAFCGTWLVFYLVGLEWKTRFASKVVQVSLTGRILLVLAFFGVQLFEGYLWLHAGNFDLATTQVKISSMLCSLSVICLFMTLSGTAKKKAATTRLLPALGDLSFGIYLCHIVPVMLWAHFMMLGGAFFVVEWVCVLLVSAALVKTCQAILPARLNSFIGFV